MGAAEFNDKFWKSVDPSIDGYSERMQMLLDVLNDEQRRKLVDQLGLDDMAGFPTDGHLLG